MKLILRIFLSLIAVVLLALTIATFVSGSLIKNYVNENGPSIIGREMHLDDASVNCFTGHIELDSLYIAEADGQTPFLSVGRFDATLSVWRVLLGTYSLHDVVIDQLRVEVQQRDTVFNFSDILDFFGESEDDEPLPVVMNRINIRDSHIHYQDLLVKSDFRISDFSLYIPGIDLRDVNTSVGVQLSLGDGGKLQTDVDYDERQQTYRVALHLTEFNLQSILPYVRQSITFGEMAGTLNVNLELAGSLSHMLDFTLRGNAGVRGLNILDPDGDVMVQCDTVAIGVRAIDLKQNRIELSRVVFDKPLVNIAYGKDSLDNFSRLMVEASAEAEEIVGESESAPETAVSFNGKEKDLRFIIDRLSIQSASVHYCDESLAEAPFVYALSDVNFSAPAFSLDGINHITASARLGGNGHLKFQYDGKITDQRNIRMSVVADGVAFSDFSPYTVQMFGNEVSSGTLSVNMLTQTVNGELSSQNRFVLDNPVVEKKRRGVKPELNIPFRTGMYLLTDRNNVCDIDLPVHGNIDEPKFSYKRLIFRTLGKLIVKVATSPFRHSKTSSGVALSGDDLLQYDDRSLDDISLDSISTDILQEE